MKISLQYGLGGGMGIGVVWTLVTRNTRKFGDGLFLGMLGISSLTWVICRHNDRIRRENVKKLMMAQTKTPKQED